MANSRSFARIPCQFISDSDKVEELSSIWSSSVYSYPAKALHIVSFKGKSAARFDFQYLLGSTSRDSSD
jgi:hypothetical protein